MTDNQALIQSQHSAEVERGERFPFGKNWTLFLANLNESRIETAIESLRAMLGREDLKGLDFIDIGSGSGLFSLAAYRLGATVTSFDYDTDSYRCTAELQRRYAAGDESRWLVIQGSVLDEPFMQSLGTYDIVYSWGVLHHTGSMWRAIEAASNAVRRDGRLFIAIYNDQGPWSRYWTAVKRFYNRGKLHQWAVQAVFMTYWAVRGLIVDLVRRKNPRQRYQEYKADRGMSVRHDWKDWLGGYPFEVASPEAVFDFCQARGFSLSKLKTRGGTVGCNEFVFVHTEPLASRPSPERAHT